MHKIAALTAIALFVGATAPALADSDHPACARAGTGPAISIDAMKKMIDDLGYTVRRLKIDDGCFKAFIVERASGGAVKAKFSLTTGELIVARPAS